MELLTRTKQHSNYSRERDILQCLSQGESNAVIAAALGIDDSTVRQHLQNLTKKLNIHGRGKLQAWAWKHGFVEQSNNGLDNKKSADPRIASKDKVE